jgi:hypothetical protein
MLHADDSAAPHPAEIGGQRHAQHQENAVETATQSATISVDALEQRTGSRTLVAANIALRKMKFGT